MKKLFILIFTAITLTACSQPKDFYFNGSDGSHSGIKYDPSTKQMSVNK